MLAELTVAPFHFPIPLGSIYTVPFEVLYCEALTERKVFGLKPSGIWKITVLSLMFLKALPLSKMMVTIFPTFSTILHVVLPCPIASACT